MPRKRAAVDAWEAIFRTQVTVLRELMARFPDEHLSFGEYDLLLNLSRTPDRSARPKDLIPKLLLTQPSVSRMLDRLVERGYLEKSRDPIDGRGVVVTMTPEGDEVFRAAAVAHTSDIVDLLGERLDVDELETLQDLLARLRPTD